MRYATAADRDAEREAFEAEMRRLDLRERFWKGFVVGAAVQGVAMIALRVWF